MTIPESLAGALMWVAVIGTIGFGYAQGWPPIPCGIGLLLVVLALASMSE